MKNEELIDSFAPGRSRREINKPSSMRSPLQFVRTTLFSLFIFHLLALSSPQQQVRCDTATVVDDRPVVSMTVALIGLSQ